MVAARVLVWLFVAAVLGCTSGPKESEDPKDAVTRTDGTSATKAVHKAPVVVLPPEDCQLFRSDSASVPMYIADGTAGIMVTRVTKPCITREGHRGYAKGSAWMAMGFPCTAGRGLINITGKAYAPKMLSFLMSTDCAFSPVSVENVETLGRTVGLAEDTKLLAYNPLSIQFWEVVEFPDTDVGDRVELRSEALLKDFWNDFRAGTKKLEVKLYGRENAWVSDDNIFLVHGHIVFEAPMNFRFETISAKALSVAELEDVKARCLELKPRRNCQEVL